VDVGVRDGAALVVLHHLLLGKHLGT
jgi:hypothetical protein